ncbi:MAG: beta-lactamase family protein [Spirochaetales bacterium]|nr:beta-lactamase family protein [Spirochaetales bacterium]
MIHGYVAPGFEEVREEFLRNFAKRGEVGAAVCAYWKGQKVVDLWGGYRDVKTREPWGEDTLVMVMSSTKGLSAMTLALAHSRGWLDYEEKVSTYWPEFVEGGKGGITVRQLLAHEAGLVLLDEPLPVQRLADLDAMAALLARQVPLWPPGERHGYHGATIGFYMNELIRRVDPAHRSLGRFFQEEIAAPLGIEFYIGLPPEVPDSRVASLVPLKPASALPALSKLPREFRKSLFDRKSLFWRTLNIPVPRSRSHPDGYELNDRFSRSVEQPSGNGIGQVRAVAHAYSEFATGGKILGLEPRTLELISAEPLTPPAGAKDEVLRFDTWYALGFTRSSPAVDFGSSRRSFGAPGAGGSFGFADPDLEVGYGYAMIKMGAFSHDDPREKALRDALYRCIQRVVGDGEPAP